MYVIWRARNYPSRCGHIGVADWTYLVQFWLLGYEFPTTLMLFTLDTLYIITTQKKG
jgi:Nucleosome binding factor SPN, SPT16 subunit